ncbi:MAG: S8 family serine peptidase [Tissierellia bacterium]|nr:S8 family serine peptidase [Tissierellia bacterium]
MKRQFVTLFLAMILILSTFTSAFADMGSNSSNDPSFVESNSEAFLRLEAQTSGQISDDEIVPLVIELDEEYFKQYGNSYSGYELRSESNKIAQMDFANKANTHAKEIIFEKYPNFKLVYELDLIMTGFTGEADYKTAKEIANEPFIKNITVAGKFNAPTKLVYDDEIRMTKSVKIIEADKLWTEFNGEGQICSVIDSGFDPSHPAFYLTDPSNAVYKNSDELPIGLDGKWFTEKVPYGYNYADFNDEIIEVGPNASMHGQHVAGTVCGNVTTLHDGTQFSGVAPEAQLLAMRVFSARRPGTGAVIYLKAIEDSIKLNASSINMSLGSPSGSIKAIPKAIIEIMEEAAKIGCVIAIAGGNEGQFGDSFAYPSTDYPDYGIVGNPSTAPLGISVAAMENSYMYTRLATLLKSNNETSEFSYDISNTMGLEYEKKYKYVDCKLGRVEDFENKDLQGKIALIERGDLTFVEKIQNATKHGAIGAVIYNHTAGGDDLFSMGTSGTEIFSVALKRSSGIEMLNNPEGQISFSEIEKQILNPKSGYITDFSNWGLSAEGNFKPEILAPGAHIYSSLNGEEYGDMSGTSMASPHVAGGITLIRQRVNRDFPNLKGKEVMALIKNLLMSTAEPHVDRNGEISSPRHQGAGIMKLGRAAGANAIVINPKTGYSAISLGDITDNFSFEVEVKNLGDKDISYNYYTNVTTDEVSNKEFTLAPRFLYRTDVKTLSVNAGESKTLRIDIDVSQFSEELKSQMANGYFIEGFVIFDTDTDVKLSIPFVGFNGSWEKLDVIEPSIYELAKQGKKPFYLDADGDYKEVDIRDNNEFKRPFTHFSSIVDGKYVIAGAGKDFNYENMNFDLPLVLSPNRDGNLDRLQFVGTFLRNYENFEIKIYKVENGERIGEGESITPYKYNGNKNHYSGRDYWGMSDTEIMWGFDGRKGYSSDYEDGEYSIEIGVKAIGNRPDGSEFETQYTYYDLIIDRVAPEVLIAKLVDNNFTFEILEEGSGIRDVKLYYNTNDGEIVIEKNADGSYTLPDGISYDQIKLLVLDRGFNKFEDNIDNLLYEGSLGKVKINIEVLNDETNYKPRISYRIVKAEDESVEITNLDRIQIGSYKLIIDAIEEGYELIGDKEILFEITDEELIKEIELQFNKVIVGTLTVKVEGDGYKDEDIHIFAINKENKKEYKFYESGIGTLRLWDAKIPLGKYTIEVRDIKAGWRGVLSNKEVVVTEGIIDWIYLKYLQGEESKIVPKTIFEDGSNYDIEYEIYDTVEGTIYKPNTDIPNGKYEVYPLSIPDGYYVVPPYKYVTIDDTNKLAEPEFVFKAINNNVGSVNVETIIKGTDTFEPEYIAINYNEYIGIEGGKVYENLNNLPYGNYWIVPKSDTYNKNYKWEEEYTQIRIDDENQVINISVVWEDLRESNHLGELAIYVDISDQMPTKYVKFELKDHTGDIEYIDWDIHSIETWFKELSYGHYVIRPVELPDGFVAKPESVEIQIKHQSEYVKFTIEKENIVVPEDEGKLDIKALDQNGNHVPGAKFTVKNANGEVVDHTGYLPHGTYTVEVNEVNGYTLKGEKIQTVNLDADSKAVVFEFLRAEIPAGYKEVIVEFTKNYDVDTIPDNYTVKIKDTKTGEELKVESIGNRKYRAIAKAGSYIDLEYGLDEANYALEKTFEKDRMVYSVGENKFSVKVTGGYKLNIESIFEDGTNHDVKYKASYEGYGYGGEYYDMDNLPLIYNSLKIEPIEVPDGYKVEPESRFIRVNSFGSNKTSFTYKKAEAVDTGQLIIKSVDQDHKAVSGAEYEVKDATGRVYEDLNKLPYGEYLVTLKSVPQGYEYKGEKTKTVQISKAQTEIEFVFEKKEVGPNPDLEDGKGSINLSVLDYDTKKPLSEGTDYTMDGVYVKDYSSADGKKKVSDSLINLEPGIYYVKITPGVNYKFEYDWRDGFYFVNVEDHNTTLTVYLKSENPVSEKGSISVIVQDYLNPSKVFTEGVDYKVEVTKNKVLIEDRTSVDEGFYDVKITVLNDAYEIFGLDERLAIVDKTDMNPEIVFKLKEKPKTSKLMISYEIDGNPVDSIEGLEFVIKDVLDDVVTDYDALKYGYHKVQIIKQPVKYEVVAEPSWFTVDSAETHLKFLATTKLVDKKAIKSIEPLANVKVAFGTDIKDINLPATVVVNWEIKQVPANAFELKQLGQNQAEVPVIWNKQNSNYKSQVPGTYEIEGELDLVNTEFINPENIKPKIVVEVEQSMVDKSKLASAIEDANRIARDKYTDNSLNELDLALINAREVYNLDSSQTEIDNATERLILAIQNLKLKPVDKDPFTPIYPGIWDGEFYEPIIPETPEAKEDLPENPEQTDLDINAAKEFIDIEGHWAYDAIEYVTSNGYFKGISKNEFGPEMNMDRAMFITVLYRVYGEPFAENEVSFDDVSNTSYYAKAVNWATKVGIVTGYDDGLFHPHNPINRQEMAVMLARYLELAKIDKTKEYSSITDMKSIPDWAIESVEKILENGIMKGRDDGRFDGEQTATRAEVAQVIYNMLKN